MDVEGIGHEGVDWIQLDIKSSGGLWEVCNKASGFIERW
jgi:hypothetical protein